MRDWFILTASQFIWDYFMPESQVIVHIISIYLRFLCNFLKKITWIKDKRYCYLMQLIYQLVYWNSRYDANRYYHVGQSVYGRNSGGGIPHTSRISASPPKVGKCHTQGTPFFGRGLISRQRINIYIYIN